MAVERQPSEAPDRAASSTPDPRIESLVESLLDEEAASAPLSDEEIRRRHPDLAEPLLAALRDARSIAAVAKKARQAPPAQPDVPDRSISSDDLSILRQALPDYDIQDHPAHGGQGVVYKAVQKSTGKFVAIKLLLDARADSPSHRRRFEREIDIVRELEDRNFVELYDTGIVLGRAYFVMKYIDGLPIDQYLARRKASLRERIELFVEVCRAVGRAHQKGFIHRDLKPGNIFVDAEGEPVILDLGLAKALEGSQGETERSLVSSPDQVVGTLPFLSPEQARGDTKAVDTRSDVYSLGVVLYLLLTGQMPYPIRGDLKTDTHTISEVQPTPFRKALAETARRSLPPDDLEKVVGMALAKEKPRRYASALAFAEDLERFLSGRAVEAKRDSAFYVLRKTLWRYRVQTGVAAAFVVLLVAALVVTIGLYRKADHMAKTYQSALTLDAMVRQGIVESNEGHRERAENTLKHVLEIAKQAPADDETTAALAFEAHQTLAIIARSQGRISDYNAHSKVMFEMAKSRTDANPKSLVWARNLAGAYLQRANERFASRSFSDSLAAAEAYLAICERLAAEAPSNPRVQLDLVAGYQLLGNSHTGLKNYELALQCYQRALDLLQQVIGEEGSTPDQVIRLAKAEFDLAVGHVNLHTEEHYRTARSLYLGVQIRLDQLKKSGSVEAYLRDVTEMRGKLEGNLQRLDAREAELRRAGRKQTRPQPVRPSTQSTETGPTPSSRGR